MGISLLFVCLGNICMSSMAEFVMKAMVQKAGLEGQFYIELAAIGTEKIGHPVYPPLWQCAEPWYIGDFEATWQDVAAGCCGLLKVLTAGRYETDVNT